AYEQCAGFLRISGGKNILDNTGVHPESYEATEKILNICSYNLDDVLNSNISDLSEKIESIGKEKVAEQIGVGVPTLEDIVKEITRPGRDPRDTLPPPMLRTDVMDINDLKIGMEMKGTVRNVIDFGVFVDIGVHRDGLVHISQISQKNIKHPSEVLQVGDIVTVWIKEVDVKKNRISLTMLQEKLQKDIQKEN
ncbi:MAG: S1 RNA-binding domain-containing protein, partial [Clostridia bacterium]|nr:S1 RNA-binding domain-containing protein [Clostridia bacterium]